MGGLQPDRLEIVAAAGDVRANPGNRLPSELPEFPEQDGGGWRVLLREDHLRVGADRLPDLAEGRRLVRGHDYRLQYRAAEFGERVMHRLQERLRRGV